MISPLPEVNLAKEHERNPCIHQILAFAELCGGMRDRGYELVAFLVRGRYIFVATSPDETDYFVFHQSESLAAADYQEALASFRVATERSSSVSSAA